MYEVRPDIQCIWVRNGLTSLFVWVLTLAASELAETDRQREFVASAVEAVKGRCSGGLPKEIESFRCRRSTDRPRRRVATLGDEPTRTWAAYFLL
jgi:hypothetical protein